MKRMILCSLLLLATSLTWGQKPDKSINKIQKSIADNNKKLKKYEWIETTTTYVKGSEKSKEQKRCYYDASGTLVKVETGAHQPKKAGGSAQMEAYIKQAIDKVK